MANNFINTNVLYLEKEEINRLIKKISDKKEISEKLESFEPPFEDLRIILEKMGIVLYKFIIKYLKDRECEKCKQHKNCKKREPLEDYKKCSGFKFYFWPGFSTIKNKRVFIWGSKTGRKNQNNYFTGIGWDENGNKFYDCPTTLAYDQVLNNNIFVEKDFFSGSTHHFRINQNTETNCGKDYLKLRVNCGKDGKKGNIFKALHVTNDEKFKEDESSQHTLHIKIEGRDIKKSGLIIKGRLDKFINIHNNNVEKNKYLWQWPFDVLTCEKKEKEKNKNLSKNEILELCKEYQQKFIDIQTHLYSYWIAETLGDGSIFRDETNKKEFKNKLHELLEKSNMLDLEQLLGFFEKIEGKREGIKTNLSSTYKDIYFNHWYTIFHEGVTVREDLGSTMLLASQPLPPELLFYISSWIEDIYNNLKLLESKTIAEFEMQKQNFRSLYHTQIQYFNYFATVLEETNSQILIPIVRQLSTGLDVANNYEHPNHLREHIDYDNTKESINVGETVFCCKKILETICKDETTLTHIFFVNEKDLEKMKEMASKGNLINPKTINPWQITTHKSLFELLIKELLCNAIKHTIHENPDIQIIINTNEICFINNSEIRQEELPSKIDNSNRPGFKIIKTIADALRLEINPSPINKDNDSRIWITLKLKNI